MKLGKTNQNLCRNVPLTQFIVAVCLLRTVQRLGHVPLGKVRILSQIPQPWIYHSLNYLL